MGVPDSLQAPMEDPPITASLGPIDRLICQLKSLEGSKHTLPLGISVNQIQKLREHLEKFRNPLKNLSEMEDITYRAKWWMKEVRELCYDTEDYLVQSDAGVHRAWIHVLLGRIMCWFSTMPMLSQFLARAEVLKQRCPCLDSENKADNTSLKKEVKAVDMSLDIERSRRLSKRTTQLFKVLAFDGDKHVQLKVVTICGVAGAGKTTCARTLYVKYKMKFQCSAFVRISRDPDIRSLLISILSQIKAAPSDLPNVQDLVVSISRHLQGKRYFIVIDDVRKTSVWDIISHAFPGGVFRSRIIIITESERVASTCSGHISEPTIFKMGALNSCTNTTPEEKNRVLNSRYNNLPLHLKTCLLYISMYREGCTIMKDDLVKEWVAEGFVAALKRHGTAETSEVTQDKREKLSEVPQDKTEENSENPQDKTEEISEIPQDKSDDISEVSQDKREEVAKVPQKEKEETARGYFDELVTRGMIQPVDINRKGEVLSCTVDHTILDLIRYKSKEENFIVVVHNLQSTLGHPDIVRRLSVQFGCEKGASIPENLMLSKVRSLTFHGFLECVPSIVDYRLLRVLILDIFADEDKIFDLTRIGELYQLRYLKIECNITVRLPSKIRRLQHLGTLELHKEVVSIPSDIGHLKKLMHVYCPSEADVRVLGDLTSLLDLKLTCSTVENLEDNMKRLRSILEKLSSLRCLALVPATGSYNVNTLANASRMIISCDSLCNVSPAPAKLQRLELSRHCCIFSILPKWIGELNELCILKIAVRELSREDIDILKRMPALSSLSLHVQKKSVERIVFGKEGFSVLTIFKFMCTVPWLEFEADAMPNLEKLKLCFNSPIVDEQGTTRVIIIEHLTGLKEIFAIIGSTGVDAGSAWRKAIKNDSRNPKVQLTGSIYYGDQGRGMVTHEGSGEDEKIEADIRIPRQPESSRQPVPVRCREDEPEDRPLISEIISIPSESKSTDGHTGQVVMHSGRGGELSQGVGGNVNAASQVVFGSSDPISVTWKDDNFNSDQEKTVKNMSGEETNMQTDEFQEAIQRKIVESASRKGKNKLSSSENAEVDSMDIDSSAGQTEQCKLHPLQIFSRHYPTNTRYLEKERDRAINLARGAMGSLLDKLGKLVTEDYNLDTSIKQDIESLSVDLKIIHRELPKLEKQDGAKIWVDEVRELSYHIEDMVDSFLVHVEPEPDRSGFTELRHEGLKLLDYGMTTHRQIGDVIRNIKEKVQFVADRKMNYNFDVNNVVANATAKAAIEELWKFSRSRHKDELIGIQTPRNELIRLLKEDGDVSEQKLKIVSIVGMGGLGKTILAKVVYDKLQAVYDTRAFVHVGQNPDMLTVLRKIISVIGMDVIDCKNKNRKKSVHAYKNKKDVYVRRKKKAVNSRKTKKGVHARKEKGVNAEDMVVHQLVKNLNVLLQDKRYFIIIDDIWNTSDWEVIRHAFPENKHGSIVITTTRNNDVALACCVAESKYVYRIKPLSDVDSRRLFFGRAFGPGKDFPDTLRNEKISTDILKKCDGLPLALISIGSVLAGKSQETWEHVGKSLGVPTKGNSAHDNMMQILDLSYKHLPDHLKTCLVYVSMYPKDWDIDKNDLLRQWVAEGFVPLTTYSRLDAEEIAENYFKELINMSMIQPGKVDYNNEVLSCRVHDIVLDLIRSKLNGENFIQLIDGSEYVTGTCRDIRRVSVHCNNKDDSTMLATIKGSLEHVRSVLLYRGSLVAYFLEFKYVRVLHLEDEEFSSGLLDLTGIGNLFLLRYLKIVCSGSELKLPDQIGQLQQLETIDLKGCRLRKYPSDIVSLPWLSHLGYDASGIALPDGIGQLKSLCTLEGVCVYKSSVDDLKGLGELANLRKLQVCSRGINVSQGEYGLIPVRMDALYSSISRLSTSLKILAFGDGGSEMLNFTSWSTPLFPGSSRIRKLDMLQCKFQRCPEWIGQLHHLNSLSITVMDVAGGLSIVGGLPSLAYFHVVNCTGDKELKDYIVIISGFQALKHLSFHCRKVKLTFEDGALPRLEKLDIQFPYHMIHHFLPVGIEHLPFYTLKEICLSVSKDNMEVDGSQDWDEEYSRTLRQHKTIVRSLLKRAFKAHHPCADIVVRFEDDEGVDDEEEYNENDGEEGAYDEEDYYDEDDEGTNDEEAGDSEDDEATSFDSSN